MMFTLVLITCFAAIVSGSYNFMNCPGNRAIFGITRRCCTDNELPNGCECFDISTKSDFTKTLNLPLCPKDLNTIFYLYTRKDRRGTTIKVGNLSSLFDGSKKTKIIIHGFTGKAPNTLNVDMMNALLDKEDVNVILVNWNKGAKGPNYLLASANTRSVGAMVARLIQELNKLKHATYQSFHLIGHSLGAHVAGIAGKEIQRLTSQRHSLGRISGLDAAGPLFGSTTANVRLDKSDANFVDVIHTNADELIHGGFGIHSAIGHVDFYPNGGKNQAGCPKITLPALVLENGINHVDCSHVRAMPLYTDSISRCTPKPTTCPMGYYADTSCRGNFSPTTAATSPFCVN